MFIGPVNVSLAPAAVTEGTSITATVDRIDRFHLLRGLLGPRMKSPESEAVRDKFHRQVEKFAEPLSFANVLLLAVVLYALFGRRRTHFAEHGVFSMHFMSFVLFTALLFAPVPALMRAGVSAAVLPLIAAVVVWQFIYLVLAIRRFYFGPRVKSVLPNLKAGFGAVAIYFLNSVFITCVQTLGTALALWTTIP
jgi:hypothetical protein